jgi:Malonyl-CoA decarboxylase C-terminal domain
LIAICERFAGVELGNELIKSVVRELLIEIPNISQFAVVHRFRAFVIGWSDI